MIEKNSPDLNPEQWKAVTFEHGPLLILAGAGSGKTRCLTYRVAWLMAQKKVHPESILLLTFTNKAAGEMKNRVKTLLSVNDSRLTIHGLPWSGTFHSWCALTLRKHSHLAGLKPQWIIYDDDDKYSLLKEIISDLDLGKSQFKPRSVGAVISQAKNELISALEYPQYAKTNWQNGVANIYLEYHRRLKKFSALDFDDLLLETIRLFNADSDLLARYQHQIQYLLVDEYQDTNTAQYQLTKMLVRKNRQLTAVGDFSQAIYQFRGANYRNLLALKQDFPDITVQKLEKNYRSPQSILDVAHRVICHNTRHPILKLWTDRRSDSRVKLHTAPTEQDEAFFIAGVIKQNREKDSRNFNCQDFAVLYRTNAQSRVFEEVFLSAGIPYILVGAIQFYKRMEVKDCLSYLRLLYNPDDEVSQTRALKIGKKRYRGFRRFAHDLNLGKTIHSSAKAGESAGSGGKTAPTTEELLNGVLKAVRYLERYDENDPGDLARIENVKELLSVAASFPDLGQFLEQVALVEKESAAKNQHQDAVTLMTLHSAKGLEFPVVFISGLEEGLLPHRRSLDEPDQLEEERRLIYVGITRAKTQLYFTNTRRRLMFGRRNICAPSRFIDEIGKDLIEII